MTLYTEQKMMYQVYKLTNSLNDDVFMDFIYIPEDDNPYVEGYIYTLDDMQPEGDDPITCSEYIEANGRDNIMIEFLNVENDLHYVYVPVMQTRNQLLEESKLFIGSKYPFTNYDKSYCTCFRCGTTVKRKNMKRHMLSRTHLLNDENREVIPL